MTKGLGMPNDGKQLESLVAFVEQALLPQGFKVSTNQCVYNDEGVQIAEFDVEVRGKLGTTNIAWLIECRDRPGDGAAPASWIEQLFGRRARFGFNKVTAVSTTGFAAGAVEFAKNTGIELRTVETLSSDAFAQWLGIKFVLSTVRTAKIANARMLFEEDTPPNTLSAIGEALATKNMAAPVLRSSTGEAPVAAKEAFLSAVHQHGIFDSVRADGTWHPVNLDVRYREDSHYLLDTTAGPVPVRQINFEGELRIEVTHVPLERTQEYRGGDDGTCISQLAAFTPCDVNGNILSFEMHRFPNSGEIAVVLRPIKPVDGDQR